MFQSTHNLVRSTGGKLRRVLRQGYEQAASLDVRVRTHHPSIPPGGLINQVAGSRDARWFLGSGEIAASVVCQTLAESGLAIEKCRSVLDFGCGVGRVMRHWAGVHGPRFYGTDYNPLLIDWCRRHLEFADFRTNTLDPGLEYADGFFDVVYAWSVFTHLSAALQQSWMQELARVLQPGGRLLISVHGEYYLPTLSNLDRERFRAGALVVTGSHGEGSNGCAAFHPEAYVRIVLARDWQVISHVAEGARGNPHQDLYLLRKPAAERKNVA